MATYGALLCVNIRIYNTSGSGIVIMATVTHHSGCHGDLNILILIIPKQSFIYQYFDMAIYNGHPGNLNLFHPISLTIVSTVLSPVLVGVSVPFQLL
jgi:hypothetical protein